MTTITWDAEATYVTALSTELNSISAGALCTSSTTVSGQGLKRWAQFNIGLASLNPTADGNLGIYVKYCAGSIFDDLGDENGLIAIVGIPSGSAVKHASTPPCLVGPGNFKIQVKNNLNVALAASGNILAYRLFTENSA